MLRGLRCERNVVNSRAISNTSTAAVREIRRAALVTNCDMNGDVIWKTKHKGKMWVLDWTDHLQANTSWGNLGGSGGGE